MVRLSFVTSFALLCCMTYVYTQQCEQTSNAARFDCHPENNPTEATCIERKCCWRSPIPQTNATVPYCYYPSDFPAYEITSNEPTAFGQQIRIVKSQTTYMPHDILNLTVDLIYETQQRLRIRIYDSVYKRYEVPLQVPVVEKKADTTDYEVRFGQKPFAILVTRKSTGVTL